MKNSRNLVVVILVVLAGVLIPVTTLTANTGPVRQSGTNALFTVTGTMPTANALAVNPGAFVRATFNQPLDQASVSPSTFVIHGSQTGSYDGAIVFPGASSARFNPAANFKVGETIQVSAARGILSNAADPLDPPLVWQFEAAPGKPSGLGTGLLDPKPSANGGWKEGRFTLGDLDGDGDLDAIVISDCGAGSNTIWINVGTGLFSVSSEDVGEGGHSAAFGDVDLDGDLDLFIAAYGGGDIWLNDSQGGFSPTGQALSGNYILHPFVRDIDGDGDLDIFLSGLPKPRLFLNDGSGQYSLSPHDLPEPDDTEAAGVGDIDADGDLDLIFAGSTTATWLNDGRGYFTKEDRSLQISNSANMALGDADGDGDLDVLLVAEGSPPNATYLWLNNGQGVLDKKLKLTGSTQSGALADIDSDGDLDVLLSGYEVTWAKINDGQGNFDSDRNIAHYDGRSIVPGDLDGDGSIDFVLSDDHRNLIFFNYSHEVNLPIVAGIGRP